MAVAKDALQELDDGELYLHVTPGRAQALVEALRIALASDELVKSKKGVVTAVRELLSAVASGQTLERNPSCSVYIVPDTGPDGEQLTKIGHALDVDRRFARCTDRPERLEVLAAWRFASIAEAMKREAAARKDYDTYDGGGGREWVKANAKKVRADLKRLWGEPDWP
jgi:hypothetical protein